MRIGGDLNLYSFHEPLELLPDITCSLHGAMLNKILITPLRRVPSLRPLVVHVQQRQVITSSTEKIHARVVRVYDFILRTVKDGVIDGQHGCDCKNLLHAFVSAMKGNVVFDHSSSHSERQHLVEHEDEMVKEET